MKRVLLLVCAVAVVGLAIHWLRLALMSDEARIQALLQDMANGFNRSRAGAAVEGLADDFREETSSADRQTILQVLRVLFLRERDSKTKEFLYRVQLPTEELKIEVLPDQRKANVDLVASFFKLHGEEEQLTWEVRINGDLEKGEEGWQIKRCRHETVQGRMKF